MFEKYTTQELTAALAKAEAQVRADVDVMGYSNDYAAQGFIEDVRAELAARQAATESDEQQPEGAHALTAREALSARDAGGRSYWDRLREYKRLLWKSYYKARPESTYVEDPSAQVPGTPEFERYGRIEIRISAVEAREAELEAALRELSAKIDADRAAWVDADGEG